MSNSTAKNNTPDAPPTIEELDEELRKEFGACPLCGKRALAKTEEREWCKNCGWHKEMPEAR